MTIKVSSRKQKGRKFQQWIAAQISNLLKIPVQKDGDIESRPMAQSGVDVILRGTALKLFPFSVEAKHQEAWAIPAWIKQAKANANSGTSWLLFVKKNRTEPIVILSADDFFRIYEQVLANKGE